MMSSLLKTVRWWVVVLAVAMSPLSVSKPATAQTDATQSAADEAKHPRALQVTDVDQWERVVGFEIAPSGDWCGYVIQPNEGDVELTLKQLEGDKKYSFTAGPGTGEIQFSHDGRWAAFRSAPLDKEAKAAAKRKEPLKNKGLLIDLESGEKIEFEAVQVFSFSGESSRWFAVHRSRPKEQPSGEKGWDGSDLVLHQLDNGNQLNFGNVSAFGFNKSGDWLAMTIDAEGQAGNALQLFETETNRLVTLDSDRCDYKSLGWTKEGDALVALKGFKDEDFEDQRFHLMAVRDLDASQPIRIDVDPKLDAGIPEAMTISPNRQPEWTKDRSGVLFGIHELKPKQKEDEAKGSEADNGEKKPAAAKTDEEDAEVVVWHWEDKRLQSMQQVQENRDKNFSFLCLRRGGAEQSLRLGTEEMPEASVVAPHRYAIAIDDSQYELLGNLDGQRFRDVYSIDLQTGKRRLALEKYRWMTQPSPTGDHLLFYRDQHFHVLDLASGETRNITAGVPTSFVDTEDDHNVVDPPISPLGWSKDGESVLLFDLWDLWRVPIQGGPAVNLTVNGRSDGIRYRRRISLDPDEEGIDFGQPQYLTAYGERNKKHGIARLQPGQAGVEMLLWDDAMFGPLSKVKDREIYFFTRESQQQSPDFYVAGANLDQAKQVTQSNPQQKDFLWSAGAKVVDYQSTHGDPLQAALFLPADYIEGKRYPTIVYIYEKLSQRLNDYDAPRVGGLSASIYTSQGYAVLMPDITYRVNDPGMSAVACVMPALDAAIQSGVVDPQRVGLHGHSWGGYQTSFLITQTDRFKAAAAGAPLTNLISMYSSIYWNSGSANQPIFESSQGRFTGGYWTNIEAYTRNSPVYYAERVTTPLLLLHNDEDGAVDWNQGIEYFNTLRRLNKPVVMLQYTGENHGLRKLPNRKDYSYRMLQFFDHHLKDKPAPSWWTEGVKHLDLKEHIKELRQERETSRE